MHNIYCQRCWLILENIETIFEKFEMRLCSGVFCSDACFYTGKLHLALLIVQHITYSSSVPCVKARCFD